jgi:hypothetical protein
MKACAATWKLPRTAPALIAFAAAMISAGCNASEPEPAIDARIWRMVRCIECIQDEQANVVAMGESAIPGLRHFLLNGPPDTTVARQDSLLRAPYSASPPAVGLIFPPAQLVEGRVQDFIAMYRMRSSIALGLIGTDSARRTLCAGKGMQFRADVRRFIDSSLALLNGSCP